MSKFPDLFSQFLRKNLNFIVNVFISSQPPSHSHSSALDHYADNLCMQFEIDNNETKCSCEDTKQDCLGNPRARAREIERERQREKDREREQ